MDLFGSKKSKERKSHFKNLIGLAATDGNIGPNERELILQIGKRIGMTKKEVESVLKSGNIAFSPPETPEERFEQLYDLVLVMLIDGTIHQREMDYCLEMAMAMGFRPTVVNELIDFIVEQANKGAQKEQVKSEAAEFLEGFD